MSKPELLSSVAVLKPMPAQKLSRGQVGTVVEILPPDAVAVEFVDDDGQTYALASLLTEDIVVLHHRPLEQIV